MSSTRRSGSDAERPPDFQVRRPQLIPIAGASFPHYDKPTVCLGVTYVVVYAYGHDNGKIWPPRCAVIVAARGDRCHPLPACSTPPAAAGSVRSALAVES